MKNVSFGLYFTLSWIPRCKISTLGGDYMMPVCRDKFQPVQPEHSSPYDYMGEGNFILATRGSFPPGVYSDLFKFSFSSLL